LSNANASYSFLRIKKLRLKKRHKVIATISSTASFSN
jgi:hypothetical protein